MISIRDLTWTINPATDFITKGKKKKIELDIIHMENTNIKLERGYHLCMID